MTMTAANPTSAPAVVPASSLGASIRVEQLTCALGAELQNVNLGAASRDFCRRVVAVGYSVPTPVEER